MNCEKVTNNIVAFLQRKAKEAKAQGYVLGVSGGVDSALVSSLCARTGLPTYLIELPINRKKGEISERAYRHCQKLVMEYDCTHRTHDLSDVYNAFVKTAPEDIDLSELAKANLSSRLRMCSVYAIGNTLGLLVVGTGNKVEDFGIGFFTKYGDGGVDISPIGDLLKSEVRELARYLGVAEEIVNATPTDELWSDTRSDESAIGASYDELEWAMRFQEEWMRYIHVPDHASLTLEEYIEQRYDNPHRHKKVMAIYLNRHYINAHKMTMPPICELGDKN